MTDTDRCREAARKVRDALQALDALRAERASLQAHLLVEDLSHLLTSAATTLRTETQ